MTTKSFVNGHEVYFDHKENSWRYNDTNEAIGNSRPCMKCNQYETPEGHDYCIANLKGVSNACCGHGVEEGYIQFEDGRVIRGNFTTSNN